MRRRGWTASSERRDEGGDVNRVMPVVDVTAKTLIFLQGFEAMMLALDAMADAEKLRGIAILEQWLVGADCEQARHLFRSIIDYARHHIDDKKNHGTQADRRQAEAFLRMRGRL